MRRRMRLVCSAVHVRVHLHTCRRAGAACGSQLLSHPLRQAPPPLAQSLPLHRAGAPTPLLLHPAPHSSRSYEDVYSDPGSPLSRRTSRGSYVLAKVDGKRQLLMVGTGASPEGNKPFLGAQLSAIVQTRAPASSHAMH